VFYSRWRSDPSLLAELLPLVALALLFVLCWRFRRGWGRHALLGIGCFTLLLFPSLGFFDAQCFTKFQVSDHLQYLPLIAMTSLAGAAFAMLPGKRVFLAVGVLAMLSLLSFKRAAIFATEEGLLRDTLAKNPAAWPAHNDLGVILVRQGKIPAAADEFKAALQFQPKALDALANLAQCDVLQGRSTEACDGYREALRSKLDNAVLHEGLAGALQNLGRGPEAIGHLKIALRLAPKNSTRMSLAGLLCQTSDYRSATEQFRQVLSFEPDNVAALNNLAYVLAGCPDDSIRDGDEAVKLAERACGLTNFKQPGLIKTLAAAYAAQGRDSDAMKAANLASRVQLEAEAANSARD
jgi:tetratricopeptide (TPR) repeat protein